MLNLKPNINKKFDSEIGSKKNEINLKSRKKAVAYNCTLLTNDISIKKQEASVKDYAWRNNIEILKMFKDENNDSNRPAFKDSMEYIDNNNEVNVFIVWKYDRLHSNIKETLLFVDEMKEIGVSYISVAQSLDTTNLSGRRFFQKLCTFSEFQREIVSRRCSVKRLKRLIKKKPKVTKIPTGYDEDWNIIKEKEKILNNIFNTYLIVRNLKELSKYCKQAGYERDLSISLGTTNLRYLLRNRAYTGEYIYERVGEKPVSVEENHHMPIIKVDIFQKVQYKLDWSRRDT